MNLRLTRTLWDSFDHVDPLVICHGWLDDGRFRYQNDGAAKRFRASCIFGHVQTFIFMYILYSALYALWLRGCPSDYALQRNWSSWKTGDSSFRQQSIHRPQSCPPHHHHHHSSSSSSTGFPIIDFEFPQNFIGYHRITNDIIIHIHHQNCCPWKGTENIASVMPHSFFLRYTHMTPSKLCDSFFWEWINTDAIITMFILGCNEM